MSFVQVQNILDQNRLLINEINQNHESKIPDNLSRNVGLIRELNNNIRRVVDLYADLSTSFTKSMDASSEGDLSGLKSDKVGHKRNRIGMLDLAATQESCKGVCKLAGPSCNIRELRTGRRSSPTALRRSSSRLDLAQVSRPSSGVST
ncbi:ELF4-like 3 [Actinidia rufa]|uniref:ELF4-like 3 n=1 Tax=Actinidia rufa TaxID=165716 RepID=A0A7J0FII7_9ERIC|nr:ELF4-like 3 [Actinidia rufa]